MSALHDPFYLNLKNTYINLLETNIKNNKAVPLSHFKDKAALVSHVDTYTAWENVLEAFKSVCTSIETPAPEGDVASSPTLSPAPTITDGEIVE